MKFNAKKIANEVKELKGIELLNAVQAKCGDKWARGFNYSGINEELKQFRVSNTYSRLANRTIKVMELLGYTSGLDTSTEGTVKD